MIVESKQNWLGMHLNWTKKKKKERRNWDDANIFELRGDDGGRDGVGCDGTVARGDKESVEVRGVGWGPSGSENGSGLDFPLLENGFSVCVFVPVRGVAAHCYSPLAFSAKKCSQRRRFKEDDDPWIRAATGINWLTPPLFTIFQVNISHHNCYFQSLLYFWSTNYCNCDIESLVSNCTKIELFYQTENIHQFTLNSLLSPPLDLTATKQTTKQKRLFSSLLFFTCFLSLFLF